MHCRMPRPPDTSVTSIRAFQSPTTVCAPGYTGASCLPCLTGAYCLGGVSTLCPSGTTTAAVGASSVTDCVCSPGPLARADAPLWRALLLAAAKLVNVQAGYYTFPGANLVGCILCDAGYWCLGGGHSPIACLGGGACPDVGSTGPAACACPTGTYTLLCLPCPLDSLCAGARTLTPLTTLSVSAWFVQLRTLVSLSPR